VCLVLYDLEPCKEAASAQVGLFRHKKKKECEIVLSPDVIEKIIYYEIVTKFLCKSGNAFTLIRSYKIHPLLAHVLIIIILGLY